VAIGQEVSVTPVQIISAISAIANGGTLYRSHVVQEIRGSGSADLPLPKRPEPTEVTDAKTAATVREMMENVILKGTGTPARLNGYTAAGKSGTAQKIDTNTGRYSPNQYVASFVGFAPVNEPAVTILVVLDSPEGAHHGGEVGGPVFKRVAEQVLAYLDVPHDVPVESDSEFAKKNKSSAEPDDSVVQNDLRAADRKTQQEQATFQNVLSKSTASRASTGTTDAPTTVISEEDSVDVPDLTGKTVRGVTESCSRLGLIPELIGSGVAVEQTPDPGTRVQRGSSITVRFGRAAAVVSPAATPVAVQRNVN
jgi:membrane peptidoglycan carboxypeptidase